MTTKLTHKIDKARFHQAMLKRGWVIDQYGTWIIPTGNSRVQSEKEWTEALLESIECPHEEAGVH